jgi:hypothetical protein
VVKSLSSSCVSFSYCFVCNTSSLCMYVHPSPLLVSCTGGMRAMGVSFPSFRTKSCSKDNRIFYISMITASTFDKAGFGIPVYLLMTHTSFSADCGYDITLNMSDPCGMSMAKYLSMGLMNQS